MYITVVVPNQRAKNKTLVGAFVDVQIKNRILKLARSRNTNASTIVCEALLRYLDSQRTLEEPKNQTSLKEGQAPEQRPEEDRQESVEEVWLL